MLNQGTVTACKAAIVAFGLVFLLCFLRGLGPASACFRSAVVAAAAFVSVKILCHLFFSAMVDGLSDYLEGSIRLDALVTWELLVSIFWPHNPTHDGAAIVHGDRVVAAGCLLPLSKSTALDPTLGTRHRAAVGLTENTDALALVVSETNGQISLAQGGKIKRNLTRLQLRQELRGLMEPSVQKGSWFARLARFFGTP